MKKIILFLLLFFMTLTTLPKKIYATEINEKNVSIKRNLEELNNISYNGIIMKNIYKRIDKNIYNQYKDGHSFIITNRLYDDSIEYLENTEFDFSEKKIAFLGDSITYGANSGDEENEITYEMVVKDKLGAKEVYNFGIGGSTIGDYWADPMCLRYVEIPKDVDYIIVFGGINDLFCTNLEQFGSLDERKEKTFCGDLDKLMNGLKNDYSNAKVIFVTPLVTRMCYDLKQKDEYSYMLDEYLYANTIKTLANEYGYKIIDLYSSGMLNTYDKEIVEKYIPDTVHPNNTGYEILGTYFSRKIVEIDKSYKNNN